MLYYNLLDFIPELIAYLICGYALFYEFFVTNVLSVTLFQNISLEENLKISEYNDEGIFQIDGDENEKHLITCDCSNIVKKINFFQDDIFIPIYSVVKMLIVRIMIQLVPLLYYPMHPTLWGVLIILDYLDKHDICFRHRIQWVKSHILTCTIIGIPFLIPRIFPDYLYSKDFFFDTLLEDVIFNYIWLIYTLFVLPTWIEKILYRKKEKYIFFDLNIPGIIDLISLCLDLVYFTLDKIKKSFIMGVVNYQGDSIIKITSSKKFLPFLNLILNYFPGIDYLVENNKNEITMILIFVQFTRITGRRYFTFNSHKKIVKLIEGVRSNPLFYNGISFDLFKSQKEREKIKLYKKLNTLKGTIYPRKFNPLKNETILHIKGGREWFCIFWYIS